MTDRSEIIFEARAKCECGDTRCPQRDVVPDKAYASARAWLLKLKFAKVDDVGVLICRVCKTELRVLVSEAGGG